MSSLLKGNSPFWCNRILRLLVGVKIQEIPTIKLIPGQKKAPSVSRQGFQKNRAGIVLLSHTVTRAIPSPQEDLTSEFGMGSGVAPLL